MKDIESIQKLLEKEVSRRDFLVHMGAIILAVLGVSSIFRSLLNYQPKITSAPVQEMGGYGASGYSGLTGDMKANLSRMGIK